MTDDIDIQEVQTVPLRRKQTSERTLVVSITPSIRAVGLEDGGSFRFDPHAIDELGMLPALGSEVSVDGRGDPLARNILHEGAGNGTLRLVIPHEAIEALFEHSSTPLETIDDIDWDDPPNLTVWAGPQLLAFELAEQRTIAFDPETDFRD